jgi:hypothetical protein
MTIRAVDEEALQTPQRSGLPPCLYIAVGARDELAIQRYVGRIVEVLAGGSPPRALRIEAYDPPDRDPRLPICSSRRRRSCTHRVRSGSMSTSRPIGAPTRRRSLRSLPTAACWTMS